MNFFEFFGNLAKWSLFANIYWAPTERLHTVFKWLLTNIRKNYFNFFNSDPHCARACQQVYPSTWITESSAQLLAWYSRKADFVTSHLGSSHCISCVQNIVWFFHILQIPFKVDIVNSSLLKSSHLCESRHLIISSKFQQGFAPWT